MFKLLEDQNRILLSSSPLKVNRIWPWVYSNKIPMNPYSIYLRGTISPFKQTVLLCWYVLSRKSSCMLQIPSVACGIAGSWVVRGQQAPKFSFDRRHRPSSDPPFFIPMNLQEFVQAINPTLAQIGAETDPYSSA